MRVACAAGKGFGPAGEQSRKVKGGKQAKQAGFKSGDTKAVERAVKLVEEREAQQQQQRGSAARPVDLREAAHGRVEYVRVKDWGSGKPDDLGSLQVEEPATHAFVAGGAAAMPFHEALARRLELLQSQGALSVAQLQGSKPLPPFERWAFAEAHYVQYLADLYAVHAGLERSMAQAAAALGGAAPAGAPSTPLLSALQLFGPQQGLDRASALLHDLRRIVARSQQQGQGQAAVAGGVDGGYGGTSEDPPPPTQHAAALAAYLASLARLCRAAEGPDEEEQAVLRLLANAYILRLMHLTSGGRVAAAAASKLDLAAAGALAFHSEYPGLPEGVKPLDRLVENTNELGQLLSEGQQEALMQELAKAMTKGSMLLVPLARES